MHGFRPNAARLPRRLQLAAGAVQHTKDDGARLRGRVADVGHLACDARSALARLVLEAVLARYSVHPW